MKLIDDDVPGKADINGSKIRWREHEVLFVTILVAIKVAGYVWDMYSPFTADNERYYNAVPYIKNNLPFNVLSNILLPQIGTVLLLYLGYLWVNRFIVPLVKQLSLKSSPSILALRITSVILKLGLIAYLFALGVNVATYYAHPHFYNYGPGFNILAWFGYNDQPLTNLFAGFDRALGIVALYTFWAGIREGIIYYLEKPRTRREYRILIMNQFTASLVVYVAIGLFLTTFQLVNETIGFAYLVFIPSVLLLFLSNTYWLFPLKENNSFFRFRVIHLAKGTHTVADIHFPSLVRLLLSVSIYTFPFAVLLTRVLSSNEFFLVFFSCVAIQLFLVTPVSWLLYQQRKDKILQLKGVEKELVKSKADLYYLRSQINPHFLFNSLNTLYGLALLENSERTAEGIQKLGDMMRFMLHENNLDFIPLQREIEYLKNYIALQKLRTQSSPQIMIEDCISEQHCHHQIAPMLFIPLVENAFKHGISLKEKSWIKIKLRCDDQQIRFEVRNSLHPFQAINDPEKETSGIGLINIQERLKLLYNKKHQFHYSSEGKEFMVQLTLQP